MAKSRKHVKEKHNHHQEKPHSWAAVRSLFTCKYLHLQPQQPQEQQEEFDKPKRQQHKQKLNQSPSAQHPRNRQCKNKVNNAQHSLEETTSSKKCKKMKCSGSLCSNTKVMQKPEHLSSSSPERRKKRAHLSLASNSSESDASNRSMRAPNLNDLNGAAVISNSSSTFTAPSASPSISGSFRNMPFRKLSGCYECRMVVDPVLGMTRDPSLRSTIRSCPECGEIFMKPESLEVHQAVRHAVSELGSEDTSKNIVEIIFQSSWLRKQSPVCKIDRILKVQNTPRTISRFEEYRDSIKVKAGRLQPKKHPRCLADGNELLRFHCTTLMCSLGLNGSSNLCNSISSCSVCSIIKNGFKLSAEAPSKGLLTTATSGKAHDRCRVAVDDGQRAMLVCRVIAGRVKKINHIEGHSLEEYDSLAGAAGVYSNLDELYVFNPRAVLPCFVVIYTGF